MAFHIKFGLPEKIIPSLFCKGFNYRESEIRYDVNKITFKQKRARLRA